MKLALGGDMAWKKALFLGGAVLLLAACSDATAPSALRSGGSAASVKSSADSTSVSSSGPINTLNTLTDCRSGYYVRSGDKDVCLDLF